MNSHEVIQLMARNVVKEQGIKRIFPLLKELVKRSTYRKELLPGPSSLSEFTGKLSFPTLSKPGLSIPISFSK